MRSAARTAPPPHPHPHGAASRHTTRRVRPGVPTGVRPSPPRQTPDTKTSSTAIAGLPCAGQGRDSEGKRGPLSCAEADGLASAGSTARAEGRARCGRGPSRAFLRPGVTHHAGPLGVFRAGGWSRTVGGRCRGGTRPLLSASPTLPQGAGGGACLLGASFRWVPPPPRGGVESGLVVLRGRAILPGPKAPASFPPHIVPRVGQSVSGWVPLELSECCGCLPFSFQPPPPPGRHKKPWVVQGVHRVSGRCRADRTRGRTSERFGCAELSGANGSRCVSQATGQRCWVCSWVWKGIVEGRRAASVRPAD